jgi:hypothetical protein
MGPLEFLVFTFPGTLPEVSAVAALADLSRRGDVRVVDSLLVTKSAGGEVTSAELTDIPELAAVLTGPDPQTLIDAEDAAEIAHTMEPGTCALAVFVEHAWSAHAAEAVRASGGRLSASARIPADRLTKMG